VRRTNPVRGGGSLQPNGKSFMQLQYVQRVILNFIGINWPHISVATLKRL